MKLNPNCIRDILFFLEDNLTLDANLAFQTLSYCDLCDALNYSTAELVNTITLLDEAGFIETLSDYSFEGLELLDITRITYNGYQFIETIRPESAWKKVMHVGASVGSFSVDLITKVASSVIAECIKSYL